MEGDKEKDLNDHNHTDFWLGMELMNRIYTYLAVTFMLFILSYIVTQSLANGIIAAVSISAIVFTIQILSAFFIKRLRQRRGQ